ncbi:putative bifunctional diguanylate cyclase/phosphodiesterase [Planosporangium flavigriseum]|uniref:putative bifunctional diguanylate cyclase/phosphodiesterase n=1 Tax=Planosporangium flavigriseum TaxID=373681 RepID=UPI001EF32293|nr:bifunctional diguanylate cyclase/phosphodiesterase [Planosporangium flavigriseum]
MRLIYDLAPAAAVCAAAAVPCAVVTVRAARSGADAARSGGGEALAGGDVRRARLLLALALPIGALGPVVAAVHAAVSGASAPTRLGGEVAAGSAMSTLLILIGVLGVIGVVSSGRALLSHVLDGLVIGASLFYAGWTLVVEPLHRHYVGDPVPLRLQAACAVVAGPILVGVVAMGVLAAAGFKSPSVRRLCLVAAAPCLMASVLPAAVFFGSRVLTAVAAVGYACGALALALTVRTAPVLRRPADRSYDGLVVSLGLVVLAAFGCVFRLLFLDGTIDQISVATATVIGGALAAQQALARVDLRRTTDRLASSEAHFREMAHTDALTGLANRRQLLTTLQEEVPGGQPCVLLAIDLDGFKNINDTRGHDVGDAALVEVAGRLRSNVRPGDLAVRLGGDEFAVLMRAPASEATAVAERLLSVLCRPYEVDGASMFLTASIGLADRSTADTIEGLMRNADVALRFAKQRGKQRVEQYDLADDRFLRRRTELEHELRGAVERGELMLVYQPVVHLPDGRVTAAETLLRWHHPRLGAVPPDEFIPLAEEAGLIHRLGEFVLHEACHQLSRWIADGHELYLTVNVSPRELHAPEYVTRVAEVLRRHRVPPERLVLEVTEHAVAQDVQQLVERLTALRAAGVRVALDDFGSGYSSLGQLRTLPVDILKIDRTLIAPPGDSAVRFAPPLADVVVQLGNRLGLDVVAEGITEVEQRRILEEAGCRFAQGDLFGRAMPAERVEALFRGVLLPPDDRDGEESDEGIKVQEVGQVDSGREMRQS